MTINNNFIFLLSTLCLSLSMVTLDKAEGRDMVAKSILIVHVPLSVTDAGGTVLVATQPIAREKWSALPNGDTQRLNGSIIYVNLDDSGTREIHVKISENTNIIEIEYPAGTGFSFKFVTSDDDYPPKTPLRTELISVGSGGYTDLSSGNDVIWSDVSTIHILGSEFSEKDSRTIRANSFDAMNMKLSITRRAGVTLYAVTDDQTNKLLGR